MNKIQKFFIFFILFLSVAVIAYKIGDSRGYDAGFQEGYSFDCRDEIKGLRVTHEALKKAVKTQEQITFQTQKRLDSVAYHEKYGFRDSLLHMKYLADSVVNWKSAQRYNDSLSRYNINSPRKCPNGEISSTEKLLLASGYKGKFSGPVVGCK